MTHGEGTSFQAGSSREHQRRLTMSLALTSTVFVAEVISAAVTGSLALLVDAGHMLTDLSVLVASAVTAMLMRRKPSNTRTWGWARLEVITAALGALILLFVGIYALVEAGMRLFGGTDDGVRSVGLLLFMGMLGLAANIGSIVILHGNSEDNMNMRAAFLEVVNDALGSVAVIVSAIVLQCTGWGGFDAIAGGIIALMMIPRAAMLLRKAVRVLLEETPEGLDLDEVRSHMERVPHVVAVHDLHASTVSTGMPVLMAHVVVDPGLSMAQGAEILAQLQSCLREHFPVSVPHTTFQLEPAGCEAVRTEHLHDTADGASADSSDSRRDAGDDAGAAGAGGL
ncbi:cation diffusion facilitator family transporter [Bifidobacterium thermophilum]|uniref:cation diffusion facilitator family transporter n=1 Tax=Bifidobacterium thermophilum TaxID=33905 RepID=UPI0030A88666